MTACSTDQSRLVTPYTASSCCRLPSPCTPEDKQINSEKESVKMFAILSVLCIASVICCTGQENMRSLSYEDTTDLRHDDSGRHIRPDQPPQIRYPSNLDAPPTTGRIKNDRLLRGRIFLSRIVARRPYLGELANNTTPTSPTIHRKKNEGNIWHGDNGAFQDNKTMKIIPTVPTTTSTPKESSTWYDGKIIFRDDMPSNSISPTTPKRGGGYDRVIFEEDSTINEVKDRTQDTKNDSTVKPVTMPPTSMSAIPSMTISEVNSTVIPTLVTLDERNAFNSHCPNGGVRSQSGMCVTPYR